MVLVYPQLFRKHFNWSQCRVCTGKAAASPYCPRTVTTNPMGDQEAAVECIACSLLSCNCCRQCRGGHRYDLVPSFSALSIVDAPDNMPVLRLHASWTLIVSESGHQHSSHVPGTLSSLCVGSLSLVTFAPVHCGWFPMHMSTKLRESDSFHVLRNCTFLWL